MENAHLRKIIEEVPEAEAKVRMLGGFLHREDGDDDEEIQDPYGGSASEYRDCFARLRGHVAAFAETLRRA
jgi:protein-tyrosine-phosphatase